MQNNDDNVKLMVIHITICDKRPFEKCKVALDVRWNYKKYVVNLHQFQLLTVAFIRSDEELAQRGLII